VPPVDPHGAAFCSRRAGHRRLSVGRVTGRLQVAVDAIDLPGLRCRPEADHPTYENVQVGRCDRAWKAPPIVVPPRPWGVRELVAGDASEVRWRFDIDLRPAAEGFDFGGSIVRGKRGDRHIGLACGELAQDGTFQLFPGANPHREEDQV
jgi:Family of unknown function (DUF5990)